MILVLGKARSHWAPNLGCRGAGSVGWFDVLQKMFAQDVMHEWAHCHDEAANHQLPIAVAFWIIWTVSVEEWMLKLNAKFDEYSLLYSFSHFECDGYTVYNMLIQQCLAPPLTSTVKSSLFTHAHSSAVSLAARLHRCPTNHSRYIYNGWAFSRRTSYIPIYLLLITILLVYILPESS